jgi:hypothetical protein
MTSRAFPQARMLNTANSPFVFRSFDGYGVITLNGRRRSLRGAALKALCTISFVASLTEHHALPLHLQTEVMKAFFPGHVRADAALNFSR